MWRVVEEQGTKCAAQPPRNARSRCSPGRRAPAREPSCADRAAFCFPTRLGPVAIERPFESGRTTGLDDSFEVQAPSGELLFTATVRPQDIALTRDRWWQATQSIALMVLAATILLMAGPLLDWRNRARRVLPYLSATLLTVLVILAGRKRAGRGLSCRLDARATVFERHLRVVAATRSDCPPAVVAIRFPADVARDALVVALALVAVEGWRILSAQSPRQLLSRTASRLVSGDAARRRYAHGRRMLNAHEALLRDTIAQTTLDLVHFSLQPWDASRTALQVGLLVAHATVIGVGVLVFRAAGRGGGSRGATGGCGSSRLPAGRAPLVIWQALRGDTFEQQLPLVAAAVVVIAAARAGHPAESPLSPWLAGIPSDAA